MGILDFKGKPATAEEPETPQTQLDPGQAPPASGDPGMKQDDGTTFCPHCGKEPFNLRMRPIPTPMNNGRTHIGLFYCGDCRKALNAVFVDVQTLDMSGLYRGGGAPRA